MVQIILLLAVTGDLNALSLGTIDPLQSNVFLRPLERLEHLA